MKLPRAFHVAIALIVLGASRAFAQASIQQLRVEEDNGKLNFWQPADLRPDDNYVQGLIISGVVNRGAGAQLGFEIAQRMYTPPWDAYGPERPYAGVLDAEVERRSITPRRLFAVGALGGITGPLSEAQHIQNWWHARFGYAIEPGWEYQTSTELLANASARAQWLLTSPSVSWMNATVGGAARAGTLVTSASASSEAQIGWHAPHPWYPDRAPARWRAYGILGVQLDAVAHNLVIDGNNQWTSGRVARDALVPQVVWGAAIGVGQYSAVFRATNRWPEYRGGGWRQWSSLAITYGQP